MRSLSCQRCGAAAAAGPVCSACFAADLAQWERSRPAIAELTDAGVSPRDAVRAVVDRIDGKATS